MEKEGACGCPGRCLGGVGHLLPVGGPGPPPPGWGRGDVPRGGGGGVVASLGEAAPAVAVANQDALAWLAIKDTLGRGDILLQRGQRLLYNGDAVTVLD